MQAKVILSAMRLGNCVATQVTIEGDRGNQALGAINFDFGLWDQLRSELSRLNEIKIGGLTLSFELIEPHGQSDLPHGHEQKP
jgi:hypothetical protein